jgi:HK97 family phage portal protein
VAFFVGKKKDKKRAIEQKDDPNYGVAVQFFNPGQPIFSNRDFRTFVSDGYRRCATVYNCINKITAAAAGIKWKLYTDDTLSREITSHPLLDLWKKPNPRYGMGSFIEQAWGFWHLSGNMYLWANRPNPNEPPVELWALRPDLMKIVAGETDVQGYVLGWGTPKARPFDAEEIMHLKFPAYDDDWYGLSPVETAMWLVDQQNEGNAWNTALMQNAGKPASAFFAKGYLTVEQRNQVRQEILKRYSGKRNAGFPLILEADMTWQQMSMAPYELDWLQSREMNTREIASIFDVAPELVGDSAGKTFANMHEARQALYTENVLPKMDRFRDHANGWLIPMFPDLCKQGKPQAYLTYDKRDIETLAQVFAEQEAAASQKATELWNTGQCDLYTAQTMQPGMEPDPNGKGIYKIGAILVRSQDLQKYAEQALQKPAAPPAPTPENILDNPPPGQTTVTEEPPQPQKMLLPAASTPALAELDEIAADILIEQYVMRKFGLDEDDRRLRPLVAAYKQALRTKGVAIDADSTDDAREYRIYGAGSRQHAYGRLPAHGRGPRRTKALDLATAEEKSAYFASMESMRAVWEAEGEQRLQSYFDENRKAVVATIKAGDHAHTVDAEIPPALQARQSDLKTLLYQLYQDVGSDVGSQIASQIEARKATNSNSRFWDADTLVYLLSLAGQKVTQISSTELAEIQSALAEGVKAGESIPQLAKRIDDLYLLQIIPNRSTVIARTEVVAASNYGAMQAAAQSGLILNKVWLATDDARTRPDHAAADGQEVPMDDPFIVGGEELMQPGDPSGSAGNIIQCRCTVYFKRVQPDDTSKALVVAPREFKSVREFMEVLI